MGISSWFWLGKMKVWNPRMFTQTEIRKTDHLALILGTISSSEAWNEVKPMVLNTVYCWDQIPVKHLCHKLLLRNTEWRAAAWHWQPSCHFKSAGLSPVSCFMILSSFRWLHQWGFHLREDLSDFLNLSTCYQNFHMPWFWAELHSDFSNSELFKAVHQSQHPNMQVFSIGTSPFQKRVSPLHFTHLTHLLWFWYSLAAYCPCLEISTLQLPLTL